MSKISDLMKERKEKAFNRFFGVDNYLITGNRFKVVNNVISDDEIVICTNNISYWSNKDQFVLWVANNKVVYLKGFQVIPVYNHEVLGDCYLIKLNKNYFKSYNCFVNEELSFDKEDTFESLLKVAKKQSDNNLYFKLEEDKYGNRYCY